MQGRVTTVCGKHRGFLVTDSVVLSEVATRLAYASPVQVTHFRQNHVAALERSGHVMTLSIGRPCKIVACMLNGAPQAFLVEEGGRSRKYKSTVTAVPLRLPVSVHQSGVVISARLHRDVAFLDDVYVVGCDSDASGADVQRAPDTMDLQERVALLAELLDNTPDDPYLQPFKMRLPRYFRVDQWAEAYDYGNSLGWHKKALRMLPVERGRSRVLLYHFDDGVPEEAKATPRSLYSYPTVRPVPVAKGGAPDVYIVLEDQTVLAVDTLRESRELAAAYRDQPIGGVLQFACERDAATGRWRRSKLAAT